MTLETKQEEMKARMACKRSKRRARAKIRPRPRPILVIAQARHDSAISTDNYEPVYATDYWENISGVYIVGSTKHGWYKIGQSVNNVTRRAASYRALPFLIDVQRVWHTNIDCRKVEHKLHTMVADRCIRANGSYSEWFALSSEDLAKLSEYMDAQYKRANVSRTQASAQEN